MLGGPFPTFRFSPPQATPQSQPLVLLHLGWDSQEANTAVYCLGGAWVGAIASSGPLRRRNYERTRAGNPFGNTYIHEIQHTISVHAQAQMCTKLHIYRINTVTKAHPRSPLRFSP